MIPAHVKRAGPFDGHIDPEDIRQRLKLKHLQVAHQFRETHQEAKKYLQEKGFDIAKVREHSSKLITAGALAGSLLLLPGNTTAYLSSPEEILARARGDGRNLPPVTKAVAMRAALREILPETTRPLTRDEEKHLEKVFQELTGIPAKATLEGEHLNTTYGKIGAEQHLRRYPGDTLKDHAPKKGDYKDEDPEEVLKEGMAPGLGAWGYFAKSKKDLTLSLEETERWYAVVQTLYLPDWNRRHPYLREWYKYRKVLIVNTDNGKAVVAAIADSGPAAWTGKHFGGSPEVMDYLGGPRYKKGPVVLFFVDDPENKIPLGPVHYNDV